MYPEFIAIYAGLAVLAALMITVLILLIKLLKRSDVKPASNAYRPQMNNIDTSYTQANVSTGNIVFCKHCATKFDACEKFCPKCGTPR